MATITKTIDLTPRKPKYMRWKKWYATKEYQEGKLQKHLITMDSQTRTRKLQQLFKISERSEEILRLILANKLGTLKHSKLVKESNKLSLKEIALRKELGLFLFDPCQKTGSNYCPTCDGWILDGRRRRMCALRKTVNKQEKGEPNG